MPDRIYSCCGMRCDICLQYRPNVEKEDRREELCAVLKKVTPEWDSDLDSLLCDGCLNASLENARLSFKECETRKCVISKKLEHCGYCADYPCEIFPAEPSREELVNAIDNEGKWTWEDEKLMEAYNCKKYIDEWRLSR